MRYILITLMIIVYAGEAGNSGFCGIIRDTETGAPLDVVTVELPEIELRAYTGDDGLFRFDSLDPGSYIIVFNRIGYRKESRRITIEPDCSDSIAFKMTPVGLQTSAVVVTGNRYDSRFLELAGHQSILQGKELQKELGQTLASTLKSEAGIAVRAMGPAPARPVIRGLGGSRVVITEDGSQTNDLSATSPDHAVAVEPFSAEKIEVIRGPKILTRSTSTIGGIVNVVNNDIPVSLPDKINGSGGMYFESANMGWLGNLGMEMPFSDFAFKGGVSYKNAYDIRSPAGKLDNTGLTTVNYSLGGGIVKDNYAAGASYSEFSSEYGIPGGFVGAHPDGVRIEMLKRSYDLKLVKDFHMDFLHNMEVNISRSYYRHIEYESNSSIGAEFTIREYLTNIDVIQGENEIFDNGSFGLSFNYRDNKIGGFVFTPQTEVFSGAAYLFEEFTAWDHSFQFGARYAYDSYDPGPASVSNIGMIKKRGFHSLGLSFSGLKEITRDFAAGFNISRSSRPPTTEELYSQGPHLAAYSYEVGNPELSLESGYGFELFTKFDNDDIHFTVNAYWNEMDNYIIPRNTGETNYSTLLPVYASTGVGARILGAEAYLSLKLSDKISYNGNVSYTYGEITKDNIPLPMIPPLKSIMDVRYSGQRYSMGIKAEIASAQRRTDVFEEPTDGYSVLGIYGQYMFYLGESVSNLSLTIENLLNTEYYNHLSRIKSIMPEPGTNIRMVYRVFL